MRLLPTLVLGVTLASAFPSLFPVPESFPSEFQKRTLDGTQLSQCDLSTAQLPKKGQSQSLPDPSAGLSMKYALVGRGTMNYTCKASQNGPPDTNGAVAIMYDASCMAAYHSSLLHELMGGLLQFKQGIPLLAAAVTGKLSDENLVMGYHYFTNPSQVEFDFRINGNHDWFLGTAEAKVEAPDFAYKGVNNQGDGAVQWIKWRSQGGSGNLKEAFRMITAGGNPPSDCKGVTGDVLVDFAAEFYFYG